MSIEKTKLQKLLDGEVVIYLDSKEEYKECSKIIGKKITPQYYGRYCYNVPEHTYSSSSSKINSEGYNLPIIYLIDIQEKQFVLPEKWCIKRTKENCDVIVDFLNKEYERTYFKNNPNYPYVTNDKNSNHSSDCVPSGYTEITFEQFKQYVLNNQTEEKPIESEKDWTKATKEELLEEAKRRYPIGSKVNSLGGFKNEIVNSLEINLKENIRTITYNNNRGIIFKKETGEWAEIVSLPENSNTRNLIPGKIYEYIFDGDTYLDKFDSMIDGEYYFSKGINISYEKWNIYSEDECLSEDDLPKEIELATEEQIRWFEACEKAGSFIPFDEFIKPKLEVGKWYKNSEWSNPGKDFCKCSEEYPSNKSIVYSERIYNGKFQNERGSWAFWKQEYCVLASYEEYGQYLPDGHPDKIVKSVKEWDTGTYVVSLRENAVCISNFNPGEIATIISSDTINFNNKNWSCDKEQKTVKWFATLKEAEEFSKQLLSENMKEDYQNVMDIEVGDTVKCVSERYISKFSHYNGSGWDANLEFVVTSITNCDNCKVYFGGRNNDGVYSDAVRLIKRKGSNLTRNDLVEGEIYHFKNSTGIWLFLYKGEITNCKCIRTTGSKFVYGDFTVECDELKLATQQERKWLNTCIKQNKFIPESELHKYDDDGNLIEVKQEFKVGDWVTFYSETHGRSYTDKIKEWTSHSYCRLEKGLEPFKHLLKKATPDEIAKTNNNMPEYVEFIGDCFSFYTKGRIYPLNENGHCMDDDGNYQWAMKWPNDKKYMIPSTKEEFDAQQNSYNKQQKPLRISFGSKKSKLLLNISDEDINISSISIQKVKTVNLLNI